MSGEQFVVELGDDRPDGTSRLVGGRMTDTSALADRFTTVTLAGTGVTVTGERTACPHLVIAPAVTKAGRLSGYLGLTHVGTGRSLPRPLMGDGDDLRKIAELVKDLPWDFTDPQRLTGDDDVARQCRDGYKAAMRKVEFEEGERIARDYPEGWGSSEGSIPGTADGLVRYLMEGWEAASDRLHGDGPERIPFDLPDCKPNPAWTYALMRSVDVFAMVYLLAALRRVAPEVADHATAFLAGEWAGGDSIGEWMWEWRRQLDAGEPLRLPCVPSPASADGALLPSMSSTPAESAVGGER